MVRHFVDRLPGRWIVHSLTPARTEETIEDVSPFRLQECRDVHVVHVPYGGLWPKRGERAHAADAEHDFLFDAYAAIAAVEPVRDAAILRAILCDVGVEQKQHDVADPRLPYAHRHVTAGQLDA